MSINILIGYFELALIVRIDRNRPQNHILAAVDCNTTWRQISMGTYGPPAETHAKWLERDFKFSKHHLFSQRERTHNYEQSDDVTEGISSFNFRIATSEMVMVFELTCLLFIQYI